jgi:hypothetical protein
MIMHLLSDTVVHPTPDDQEEELETEYIDESESEAARASTDR